MQQQQYIVLLDIVVITIQVTASKNDLYDHRDGTYIAQQGPIPVKRENVIRYPKKMAIPKVLICYQKRYNNFFFEMVS